MDKCDRFEEKSRGQRTVESGRSPGLGDTIIIQGVPTRGPGAARPLTTADLPPV